MIKGTEKTLANERDETKIIMSHSLKTPKVIKNGFLLINACHIRIYSRMISLKRKSVVFTDGKYIFSLSKPIEYLLFILKTGII